MRRERRRACRNCVQIGPPCREYPDLVCSALPEPDMVRKQAASPRHPCAAGRGGGQKLNAWANPVLTAGA